MEMFKIAKQLVGLTKQEAVEIINATDGTYRFVKEDGNGLPITDDLRDDRVSMEIEQGIVVKAYVF